MHTSQKPSKRILLIDDDIKFSIGIVALLKREGYAVSSSRSGVEGLEMIKTQKPNLILCDMMMPPPDGLMLKKEINGDKELSAIPFLFISAKTSQKDIDSALAIGAAGYVLKPFVVSDLIDTINGILHPL
jgi:CheY-like chemotaxis protein